MRNSIKTIILLVVFFTVLFTFPQIYSIEDIISVGVIIKYFAFLYLILHIGKVALQQTRLINCGFCPNNIKEAKRKDDVLITIISSILIFISLLVQAFTIGNNFIIPLGNEILNVVVTTLLMSILVYAINNVNIFHLSSQQLKGKTLLNFGLTIMMLCGLILGNWIYVLLVLPIAVYMIINSIRNKDY